MELNELARCAFENALSHDHAEMPQDAPCGPQLMAFARNASPSSVTNDLLKSEPDPSQLVEDVRLLITEARRLRQSTLS